MNCRRPNTALVSLDDAGDATDAASAACSVFHAVEKPELFISERCIAFSVSTCLNQTNKPQDPQAWQKTVEGLWTTI